MNELDQCESCSKIIREIVSWYLDPEIRPKLNFFQKDRGIFSQSLIQIRTDKFLVFTTALLNLKHTKFSKV